MIELTLKRRWLTLVATIGELFEGDAFLMFVCEDRYRPPPEAKVPGETCIPIGRYRVTWTWSRRFSRMMLLVEDVPGFAGIRIHAGNRSADTEGCLLPGRIRQANEVRESALALRELEERIVKRIEGGEECWLTVTLEPADVC